jgi:hypothetical protein
MRRAFSLSMAALAVLVATAAYAETTEEHHTSTSDSKTVDSGAVRERSTVETAPANQAERRTSETVVEKDKGHESDSEVETKTQTKVEHED